MTISSNFEAVDISQACILLLQKDQSVWLVRPPPAPTVAHLVKTVRCLRELRLRMIEHMLQVFTHGVDIYLSVQRDADEEDLQKQQVGLLLVLSSSFSLAERLTHASLVEECTAAS